MNNNIGNMGFNPVNFGSKNDRTEKAIQEALECDCKECKQTDAEAATALAAMGKAQVNGINNNYTPNPENVVKDLEVLEDIVDSCMIESFRQGCYEGLVNNGMDPDLAWEEADRAARCFNPNL